MSLLWTGLTLLLVAWAWQKVRGRRRGSVPLVERRRLRAVFLVAAIVGFQAVALGPPAMAQDSGCEVPNPERPSSGMVGAIDPTQGQGLPDDKADKPYTGAYRDYGYAGLVWHLYDCDNGALAIPDANTTIDTWAGNQLFNVAKNIVGATNSLHYTVAEGGLLDPLYDAVSKGAEAVYGNVYAQLFGLLALLLALLMFRNIWRGDLATVSKRALFALGGLWLAASSLALLRYYGEIDRAIVQTTTNIQAGFVDTSADTVVREVLPTDLHNQVVYSSWLRGEFGSPEAPQAAQFGQRLLDAQAFTRRQIDAGDDGDAAVIEQKQQEYREISTQLGPATGYFTGEDGSRTGAGFLAMLQSFAYALFQFFAKAAVLLAQILVRLFTLTAPLIGLVAILHHDILRRVGKVVGVVAFNLLILSVLAGVHALLLQAIFAAGNALNLLTQLVVAGLVTILLFLVGKPGRRLWQMVETTVGSLGQAVPTPKGGLFSRFRKRSTEPTPQDEFWQQVRDGDEAEGGNATRGAAGAMGGRFRPEATILASAQRLDTGRHPSAHWPGELGSAQGNAARAALPAGGGAAMGAFRDYVPGRAPGDYQSRPDAMAVPPMPSRRVDTVPVADNGWDRGDADPVVIPSRMAGFDSAGVSSDVPPQRPAPSASQPMPAPPAFEGPRPRRVEPELVAGKPVFVLYRPSRGLEVRDDSRDTDRVVR